jgi:hypothetical protein
LNLGFRVYGLWFGVQGLGFRFVPAHGLHVDLLSDIPDAGFRVQGLGFRVQGSGFRVWGLGFRVQGLGFRDQGLEFRVWGLGFRV